MKLTGRHSFLGVAVGERTITVAEIAPARGGAGGWEVRKAAEFQPAVVAAGADGAGAGPVAKDTTGPAFARFLRDNGFAGTRAVIGVPARWLVAREREVPPSSNEQAAEVLRLQAERLFSAELGELAVDYAGTPDASAPRGVLLMAMPKRQLERVVKLVEAAGREVAAVMPSTLALADAVSTGDGDSSGDGLVLSLGGEAVELSARRGGAPRVLRHLPVRGPDLASQNGTRAAAVSSLAGEIRRTVALMPRPSNGDTLHLWNGVGLDLPDATSLALQAGVELRGDGAIAVPGVAKSDAMAPYAPAIALALAGARRHAGAVDFLHPRLAAPKRRRIGRRTAWTIALVGAAIIALLALWLDVRRRESALADIRTRLATDAPQIQAAEHTRERITTARGWFPEGRPAVLDCLREITNAFPDGGEQIYVTKFTLPESGDGSFSGKAPARDLVFDVVERLNASPNFENVKAVYTLDSGNASNEVSFSITFSYAFPPGAAVVAPTTAPTTAPASSDNGNGNGNRRGRR
jgi:hypothetical protein